MSLSDFKCRTAKPAEKLYKLTDGAGLQLWVMPRGSKLWRLAYRFGGKPKTLALGSYPTVTLSEAREAAHSARKILAGGINPMDAKREAEAARAALGTTFKSLATEYIAQQALKGRAEATMKKTRWVLEFAYPALGTRQITEIKAPDVLDVLRQIEARGHFETACRLRAVIGSVFRLAVASGRAESDPTTSLAGILVRPQVNHHAAIVDPEGFGGLLRAIDGFDGQPTTKAGLQLMALLFTRPGELRHAKWSEFDISNAVWLVPAERTKMRRPHKVPLSPQALAILKGLYEITGSGPLILPSIRSSQKPMSENTLNAALRRLGYCSDEATSHGFRSSASTLLNESGNWHPDAIERQLAHAEPNEVRRAYARGEFWDERVKMMSWWADYLDQLRKSATKSASTPTQVFASLEKAPVAP